MLESEVIKPLVLFLLDPTQPPIGYDQVQKALSCIESWMVRRMLVRASTKSYGQVVAELIRHLSESARSQAGDAVEQFLAAQTSESRYWPDDREICEELRVLPAYRRLGRGRLRMVIEALEDHLRGWKDGKAGLGGERVTRGKYAIEHVMPRKWQTNWPLAPGTRGDGEREALIHTIGNLTLLTSRLNSKVSNGPWLGDSGKRHGLESHDVLLLNRDLIKSAVHAWTDSAILTRSEQLAKLIVEIWPVPAGHRSSFASEKVHPRHRVDLSDLLSAGWIHQGAELFPRIKKHSAKVAVLLPDGRLDVGGEFFTSPSEAAKSITGSATNGWWFFLVDKDNKKSLKDLRLDYLESIAADPEEDDADDDDDDE